MLCKPTDVLVRERDLLYKRTEKLAEMIDSGELDMSIETIQYLAKEVALYTSVISVAAGIDLGSNNARH